MLSFFIALAAVGTLLGYVAFWMRQRDMGYTPTPAASLLARLASDLYCIRCGRTTGNGAKFSHTQTLTCDTCLHDAEEKE